MTRSVVVVNYTKVYSWGVSIGCLGMYHGDVTAAELGAAIEEHARKNGLHRHKDYTTFKGLVDFPETLPG